MKYCLYEEPEKTRLEGLFSISLLFLLIAASQILEILYLVEFL